MDSWARSHVFTFDTFRLKGHAEKTSVAWFVVAPWWEVAFVHCDAVLNISRNIPGGAKLIKELRRDLNIFWAGSRFIGEDASGNAGGNCITVHLTFQFGAVRWDQPQGSEQTDQIVDVVAVPLQSNSKLCCWVVIPTMWPLLWLWPLPKIFEFSLGRYASTTLLQCYQRGVPLYAMLVPQTVGSLDGI